MMGDFYDFGAIDYSGIRIGDLVAKHGSKLRMGYEYDFGDGWQHDVVLERVGLWSSNPVACFAVLHPLRRGGDSSDWTSRRTTSVVYAVSPRE